MNLDIEGIELCDAHAHLYPPNFTEESIREMLEKAKGKGVKRVLVVGEGMESCKKIIKMQEMDKEVIRLGFGLHPGT